MALPRELVLILMGSAPERLRWSGKIFHWRVRGSDPRMYVNSRRSNIRQKQANRWLDVGEGTGHARRNDAWGWL